VDRLVLKGADTQRYPQMKPVHICLRKDPPPTSVVEEKKSIPYLKPLTLGMGYSAGLDSDFSRTFHGFPDLPKNTKKPGF